MRPILATSTTMMLLATQAAPDQAPAAHNYEPAQMQIWHSDRTFQPLSRTAQAITGAITITDMTIKFGDAKTIDLQPIVMAWRDWDTTPGNETAELFRLLADPGTLRNSNTLCGDTPATFVALYETQFGIGMSVFESKEHPFDANSPGLCGTYTYTK
ncbi:MAG: hypothetical protein Q4G24_10660 [Paracoccus sp. (in: a-proteobacteria)]|uniref:hypothetical protein n=1 Tax=Paracoccus sp. TaxID=267 RepID=UPI0026DFCD27|nr:hypothetical protein [Paracoccus sp. (in: a-proteobacteria)]MDO5621919.1 hypothetical protein [Paracoccus sp. (in: a-proteobacteria)]